MNTATVRRQVAAILLKFPHEMVKIERAALNEYNEPTESMAPVAEGVKIWWSHVSLPDGVRPREKATTIDQDARKWVCALWEKRLEAVRSGDILIAGEKKYRIRNVDIRLDIRVFWQVEEIG